jgi:hypothetical protein
MKGSPVADVRIFTVAHVLQKTIDYGMRSDGMQEVSRSAALRTAATTTISV